MVIITGTSLAFGLWSSHSKVNPNCGHVLCFLQLVCYVFVYPYPSTPHGVSEHAFPTIILFHHITLFPIRPSKPSCVMSLFASICSIPQPVFHFIPIHRLLLSTCHPTPLLYFLPSSSSPFSMYIVVVVVLHLRFPVPTRTSFDLFY